MTLLRRLPLLGVFFGLVLVAGACSSAADSSDAADPGQTRVVSTDQGEITIPASPERIVVLNANLAGYLYALDIPVLATIPESPGPGGGDYPEVWAQEAAEDDTVMLPWGEDGFDFESILAESPDLILAGGQGFTSMLATQAFDQLNDIAPTVIVSKELLTWQDQLDFIADDVFGDADGAAQLVDAYQTRVAEVRESITLPPNPVAYLTISSDMVPFALPESSALPQTLAELGFEPAPVIADNPEFEVYGTGDSFELSTEQVGRVFTAPTLFVFGFLDSTGGQVEDLKDNPIYANLPAFRDGHACQLPSWAYRADYLRTMDLLDYIDEQFRA